MSKKRAVEHELVEYELPAFAAGKCRPERYRKWLHRRALAHRRRDSRRWGTTATTSDYKRAIHIAVLTSGGRDAYTGELLDWRLLGRFDNAAAHQGRGVHKKRFALLPTIDHAGGARQRPKFRICAWRTNDAKSDLSSQEFLGLCRAVVQHMGLAGKR